MITETSTTQQRSTIGVGVLARLNGSRRLCALLLIHLFLLLAAAHSVPAQSSQQFDVKTITNDVKNRYKLNAHDVRAIQPLIDSENKKVVKIYARFCSNEPEYSARVWMQFVEERLSFESGLSTRLTAKQKEALRSARSRMERRVVGYIVNDYVGFLSQVLELSDFEFNDVHNVFESESGRKLWAISDYLNNPTRLEKALDEISNETDAKLRRILSPDQWQSYLELTNSFTLIA